MTAWVASSPQSLAPSTGVTLRGVAVMRVEVFLVISHGARFVCLFVMSDNVLPLRGRLRHLFTLQDQLDWQDVLFVFKQHITRQLEVSNSLLVFKECLSINLMMWVQLSTVTVFQVSPQVNSSSQVPHHFAKV